MLASPVSALMSSLPHAAYNAPIFTPQNSPASPTTTINELNGNSNNHNNDNKYTNYTHQHQNQNNLNIHDHQYSSVVPLTIPAKPLRNLHIDNLPPVNESTLKELFQNYGKILRVRVVTDESGAHAGYGFVMFEREDEARHAMEELDHFLVFSDFRYKIKTEQSEQRENDADSDTKKEHANINKHNNTDDNNKDNENNINDSNQIIDDNGEFIPPSDATINPDKTVTLLSGVLLDYRGHIGKRLRISFARHRHASQQSVIPHWPSNWLPANTNLYVAGLAPHYSKHNLDLLFSPYGQILESRILLDRATGNSRGVGFVRFANQISCQQAIRAWNGRKPNDSSQPITVRYAVDRQSQQILNTQTMQQLKHSTTMNNEIFQHQHNNNNHHNNHNNNNHNNSINTHYQSNPFDMNGFISSVPLSPLSSSPLSQSSNSLSSMMAYEQFPSYLPLALSISPPQSPINNDNISDSASGYHSPVNAFTVTPTYFISPLTFVYQQNNSHHNNNSHSSITDITNNETDIIIAPINENIHENEIFQFIQPFAPIISIAIDRENQSCIVKLAINEEIAKSLINSLDHSQINNSVVNIQIQNSQ